MSTLDLPRVHCPTWDHLLTEVRGLRWWAFRGHCSARWRLESTLERRTPKGDVPLYTEFNTVREFKRKVHNYLGSRQPIPETDGEWLALMQSFGAPTRTLDFTKSPYVAAYFAFEETPPDDSPECAVIAISPAWFQTKLGEKALSQPAFFGFNESEIRSALSAMRAAGKPSDLPDAFFVGGILS